MPKLNSTMRVVYSDIGKQDADGLSIPRKSKSKRSKPTMKIDLKAKLDLEEYKQKHRLKSLGQAVAHMQRRLQE